ncbi:MAG: hypothetical protein ABUL60_11955 [Myxococcales bacterium]
MATTKKLARSKTQGKATPTEADLPAFLVEVPGVGVCQNDLHYLAIMLARGLGGGREPETPLAMVRGAVNQACADLKSIANKLPVESSDESCAMLSIVERLEATSETAEILFKLLELPHVNMAARAEAQP